MSLKTLVVFDCLIRFGCGFSCDDNHRVEFNRTGSRG